MNASNNHHESGFPWERTFIKVDEDEDHHDDTMRPISTSMLQGFWHEIGLKGKRQVKKTVEFYSWHLLLVGNLTGMQLVTEDIVEGKSTSTTSATTISTTKAMLEGRLQRLFYLIRNASGDNQLTRNCLKLTNILKYALCEMRCIHSLSVQRHCEFDP